jgi:hypothetical protein
MGKKYFMGLLSIPFLMLSCKEEPKQQETIQEETPALTAKGSYKVYEPLEKAIRKEGVVIFEKDTMEVVGEYTDGIAFSDSIVSPDGQPGIMNYRELVFHVLNKRSGDTLTFRKEMFKEYIYPDDYDKMIMQSTVINLPGEKGIISLMISLCQPDSDFCYDFDVRVTDNGKFIIKDAILKEEGE